MNNVTIVGNLTADPELKFISNGAAVVNFTIANTPRVFNKQKNEWEEGETTFLRASAWRDLAEHVTESLAKGSRVIATGKLAQKSYDNKEGQKRTYFELEVEEIGPSLKYATAKVIKAGTGKYASHNPEGSAAPINDPWGKGDSPLSF